MPPNVKHELEFKERVPELEFLNRSPLVQILEFPEDFATGRNNNDNNGSTEHRRAAIDIFNFHSHLTDTVGDNDLDRHSSQNKGDLSEFIDLFTNVPKKTINLLFMGILIALEIDNPTVVADRFNSPHSSFIDEKTTEKLWNSTMVSILFVTAIAGGIISGCAYRRYIRHIKNIDSLITVIWVLRISSLGLFIQHLNPNNPIHTMVGKFICTFAYGVRTSHLFLKSLTDDPCMENLLLTLMININMIHCIKWGSKICNMFPSNSRSTKERPFSQNQDMILLKQLYFMIHFYILHLTRNLDSSNSVKIDLYPNILSYGGSIINDLVARCYFFLKTSRFTQLRSRNIRSECSTVLNSTEK
ncbi:hypothetical protein, no similarity [Maudiozyma saulgeensis]|uniref:Uncharacterized protein n=1 Tax=Maudiozyma saulgeensis TaxID=1789683 RepID=A0A1X7R1G0_9SACH|nr:hypothetical protein, no similarity [Kazachstania saulgeensis]